MADDRRTKQQLLEALAATENEAAEAVFDAEQAREHIADMDGEAKAIASCVDALDLLKGGRRDQASNQHMSVWSAAPTDDALSPGQQRIGRVLDFLRVRYGLPSEQQLHERVVELEAELARTRNALDDVRFALPTEVDGG